MYVVKTVLSVTQGRRWLDLDCTSGRERRIPPLSQATSIRTSYGCKPSKTTVVVSEHERRPSFRELERDCSRHSPSSAFVPSLLALLALDCFLGVIGHRGTHRSRADAQGARQASDRLEGELRGNIGILT